MTYPPENGTQAPIRKQMDLEECIENVIRERQLKEQRNRQLRYRRKSQTEMQSE